MDVHCFGCDAWTPYDPSHYATPVTRCYCSACYDRLESRLNEAKDLLEKTYADLRGGESGGIWRVRTQARIEKILGMEEAANANTNTM